MSTPARRPVTVVVPVYGGPDTVSACLDALVGAIGPRDSILVINDLGPEADAVEAAVLSGFADALRYVRNPRNLGFVGTCNRAALELTPADHDLLLLNSDTVPTPGFVDALEAALDADERNGIACARSDNATIASLPLRRRVPDAPRTRERTASVFGALRSRLPEYSVSPVAMGFCFLVRRTLIDRHGLFDEAFSPGYGEENDFCLRMGELGHRSVIVHRALVFHEGFVSFQEQRRNSLRAEHEALLVARHPGYPAQVRRYLTADADPVDVFADALVPDGAPPRVLLDFGTAPRPHHAELLAAASMAGFTVRVPAPALRRMRRAHPALDLIADASLSRVWDAALAADEGGEAQTARLQLAAPRVGALATDSDPVASALALAVAPVDDAELRRRWAENSPRLERWGTLIPSRASLPGRALRAVRRRLAHRVDPAAR